MRARLRARDLVRRLSNGDDPASGDLALLRAAPRAEDALGVTHLSGREASARDVVAAAGATSLFAAPDETRVVVVEDAESLADLEALRAMPQDAAVVLVAGGMSAPLVKLVRELGGTVEEFLPLDLDGVEDWLRRRGTTLGVTLSTGARRALSESVQGDLERLDRELEKLAAYAAGATVGEREVSTLVAGAIENDVFELTRAVVRRDARTAVAVLERLLESGEPPLRLHGLLVWQFRVLIAASGVRNDRDLDRVQKQTGLSRGAVGRWRREAAGLRQAEIARAYESLYAADLAMKTGVDPRTVFQLLVLDLCGVEGADLQPLAERPPR